MRLLLVVVLVVLQVWMCGGRIEVLPCSRIGHIFKSVTHKFPSGHSVARNLNRVVEVWMPEYKHIYYDAFPTAVAWGYGDVAAQQAFRESLGDQCKDFTWFIENVFPDMFVPLDVRVHWPVPVSPLRKLTRGSNQPTPQSIVQFCFVPRRSQQTVAPTFDYYLWVCTGRHTARPPARLTLRTNPVQENEARNTALVKPSDDLPRVDFYRRSGA